MRLFQRSETRDVVKSMRGVVDWATHLIHNVRPMIGTEGVPL
jgi:hypothetical protein